MSDVQIFGEISDQNALFLMERGGKWFVIDIMYLKIRKAECWSENDSIGE